ncbi:MAG: helix-turn-helix domain-containing protein [Lachnospiraceae bacterium]|nr:helix-turn-helix domain-containing protein [Lachnospiraceae bacterium]
MGNGYEKGKGNPYLNARKAAAEFDKRLRSRESASEILNMSPDTLYNIEAGRTKTIPADSVVSMAEAYNAPELMTEYCVHECPIHGFLPLATKEKGIQGIVLRMIKRLNEKDLQAVKDMMVEIAEDGEISEDEAPKMREILEVLDSIAEVISEMKITAAKSMKRG